MQNNDRICATLNPRATGIKSLKTLGEHIMCKLIQRACSENEMTAVAGWEGNGDLWNLWHSRHVGS